MATCPVCHGEIAITDQNYGTLLTCPICRAVFFVGWDGQPEMAEQNPPDGAFAMPEAASPDVPDSHFAPINDSPQEPYQEMQRPPGFDPALSTHGGAAAAPGGVAGIEMQSETALSPDDPNVQPAEPIDFSQPLGATTAPIPLTMDSAFESIEKYSNQTQETLPLSYDVFIRGLDLPQQIQELREAITDGRFAWEPDQIIAKIVNGELVLEKMSPIKASILIQRMKYADLEIEWRQHVLT